MKRDDGREFSLWWDREEEHLIEDLRELIRIPSVAREDEETVTASGEVKAALYKMKELAEKYGFSSEVREDCFVTISFGEGEHEIGIWGHLDVVPEGSGWVYPPYELTRRGDFLIGRGVQDNKGPALAVLYALRYLKEQGFEPKVRFSEILGSREEVGMEDVKWYLENYPAPDWSFVADCGFPVCHGEKGCCEVTLVSEELTGQIVKMQGGTVSNSVPERAKAVLLVEGEQKEISASGIAGHVAFPEGSKNAIGLLSESLLTEKLGEKERRAVRFLKKACSDGYGEGLMLACEDEVSGRLTASGSVLRMEGQRLVLDVNIRYPVTADIEALLQRMAGEAEKYGFRIARCKDSRPNYVDPKLPFVETLMEAYRECVPDGKEAYVMGGGTYARKIPNAVGFGPGLSMDFSALNLPKGHGNCHCADEAQPLTNLKRAAEIYVHAFRKISRMFGEEAPDRGR